MKRRTTWRRPPFPRSHAEPEEEGRPLGWRSPKLNYEVVEKLHKERQQLQSPPSDEDDGDTASKPKAASADDNASHTEAFRGEENTSGNESVAKEDDISENDDPMREAASYGKSSALELFQDQR